MALYIPSTPSFTLCHLFLTSFLSFNGLHWLVKVTYACRAVCVTCLCVYETEKKHVCVCHSICSYINSHFPPEQTHFPNTHLTHESQQGHTHTKLDWRSRQKSYYNTLSQIPPVSLRWSLWYMNDSPLDPHIHTVKANVHSHHSLTGTIKATNGPDTHNKIDKNNRSEEHKHLFSTLWWKNVLQDLIPLQNTQCG